MSISILLQVILLAPTYTFAYCVTYNQLYVITLALLLLLCAAKCRILLFYCCEQIFGVRHYDQSKHTRGLFFHFLFVTVVKGFLCNQCCGGGWDTEENQ